MYLAGKVRWASRDEYLLATYGISSQDYERMLAAQGHVCAICKRDPDRKRLAVDHCHTSGIVRGILCSSCNYGIGVFSNRADWLAAAARYLRKKRKEPKKLGK